MTDIRLGLSDELFRTDFNWESNGAAITPRRDSALVYQFDRYRTKVRESGAASHWQAAILTKVLELVDLPENWNSYGATQVRHDTALFAMLILENIMQAGTPLPDVVPTASGGLQFEWHDFGVDLEINV